MASKQALYDTTVSFINTFKDLDIDTNVALRAPDCIHLFAPASLGNLPPKSNEEFHAHMTGLKLLLKSFPVTVKEIHVNESGRQVVSWVTGVATFKEEVRTKGESEEDWTYRGGEYIFMLDFNEEGKIKRILEFLDSKNTTVLMGMAARARANLTAS